ncbi:uncharacterized protein CCOS01_08342 [Colletotrichum costaricense]|uniref:Uncharacterized protein n=1 Tax=Colletotrichum costaricense TaxID=1209916 RepID=A0AAJ0E092_9PEZI|nr:uncharacterized protein CCOS01_08342 [Colletotrichum costaricense]KAK1525924.1 hypothetical protein CCOS01_08342 [Colletotrichum costaricense]
MVISKLPAILKICFRPPAGTSWTAGGDVSEFYGSWSFTIYRTAYGPGTDAQWRTLLDKIRAQDVFEIECYLEAGEEDVAAQLKSLFVLDARSDAALLANKTMEEVREIYKQAVVASRRSAAGRDTLNSKSLSRSLPLMHDSLNQRALLLADAEVLEGVGRDPYFWVKCVEADLAKENSAPAAHGGSHRAAVGPWSGWMKMTTRSVVDLCAEMPVRDLASIAPGARAADEMPMYNGELTGSSLTSKMSSGN